MTKKEKDRWLRETPIEEKETFCWIEGMRPPAKSPMLVRIQHVSASATVTLTIYELFCESDRPRCGKLHFLVRACHKRKYHWIPALIGWTQFVPPSAYSSVA